MKLNEQEIKEVSSLEPFKRYQYFIKRIADSENIYMLQSNEGDWASSSINEYRFFPIWPAVEYANKAAIETWSKFEVIKENIYDFLDVKLLEIESQGFLLNAFPVGDKTGFVIKTNEFIRDIRDELEKYE